jgi:hypothetical protein
MADAPNGVKGLPVVAVQQADGRHRFPRMVGNRQRPGRLGHSAGVTDPLTPMAELPACFRHQFDAQGWSAFNARQHGAWLRVGVVRRVCDGPPGSILAQEPRCMPVVHHQAHGGDCGMAGRAAARGGAAKRQRQRRPLRARWRMTAPIRPTRDIAEPFEHIHAGARCDDLGLGRGFGVGRAYAFTPAGAWTFYPSPEAHLGRRPSFDAPTKWRWGTAESNTRAIASTFLHQHAPIQWMPTAQPGGQGSREKRPDES